MGMGMNFMGMGLHPVRTGWGQSRWGCGGDGADVHYRVTLYLDRGYEQHRMAISVASWQTVDTITSSLFISGTGLYCSSHLNHGMGPLCTGQKHSFCFNSHFPDGSGLAGTRTSKYWILLELRMMEVVVTTGAIRGAKLQPNRRHQQTNTHGQKIHEKLP